MGTEGSVIISEDASKGGLRREYTAPEADWEKELRKSLSAADKAKSEQKADSGAAKTAEPASDIKTSHSVPSPGRYYPPIAAPLPPKTEHQPHLENFFHAIRGTEKLNCPGEVGYETAVTVLKVNEAIAAEKKLTFSPEEFKV